MNKKILLTLLVVLALSCALVACTPAEAPVYNVTFDAQNGSEATTVAFDSNFAMPANPVKAGFIFGGWYSDAACTAGNEWAAPETLAENVTVYAKWTEAHSITFRPQNGESAVTLAYDDAFEMPTFERADFTFVGWFTNEFCTPDNAWTLPETLDADVVVYAKWVRSAFYVTFNSQNGEANQKLRFDDNFAVPADPTKADYAFGGWYTDAACSEGKEWTVPETLTKDVTVYAKWTKVVFYVTFNTQDGNTQKVVFGADFACPTVTRDDYAFAGWYTDAACSEGKEWTVPETLTTDITVYAKWTQVVFYVNFDLQNGQNATPVRFDSNFAVLQVTEKYKGNEFGGWFTDAACTAGNEWTVPATLEDNITVYAYWIQHEHVFADSYFMFVGCQVEGCDAWSRLDSTNELKANFVYNFDDNKKNQIDGHYQDLVDKLGVIPEADYEELFNIFDDDVSYVVEQYQYANVFYHVYNNSTYSAMFDTISDYYNVCVSRYYGLFRDVYESIYRDEFFAGWTEDEIKQILALADSYGDSVFVETKDTIDSLLLEYDELMKQYDKLKDSGDKNTKMREIELKYEQLIIYNNRLAQLSGYKNYMEYAYAVRFERSYTPADVAAMRGFVKQYIPDVFNSLYSKMPSSSGAAANQFYRSLNQTSVFESGEDSVMGVNLIAEYFKDLQSNSFNNKIDFFDAAEKLFKNGNYYVAGRNSQSGAFSYWIPAQQTSILYFGSGSNASYQNAFTFVHEFGHYYNGVYNNGLSLSMDHDETQSQGNEMLFLAWLATHAPKNIGKGYTYVQVDQLVNALWIVSIATAVDEFEQAAYTGMYNGAPITNRYTDLFKTILASYGAHFATYQDSYKDYWAKVCFHSAGYYISYAMSALPCVEIYVKGMEDFEAAKTSYLKLFAFSDSDQLVEVEDGHKSVSATYQEILNYCGLQSAFQEELYLAIHNYFIS